MTEKIERFCVVIVRNNGEDVDPLPHLFASEVEAHEYAQRCCSWYQMVTPTVCQCSIDTTTRKPITETEN